MKNDINLFNEEIKGEIATCKKEEREVRRKEQAFKMALANLKVNNEKRIEVINRIRLEKLAEIEEEIQISKAELETLYKEWDSILYAYCKKHKHNYILASARFLSSTGRHSFGRGFESLYETTYKCTTCGAQTTYTTTGYRTKSQKYYRSIPEDAYDDATLSEDGKTLRIIEQEIPKLREYINYLEYLKEKMCEIFGHDASVSSHDSENFRCKCCGKIMSYQEYINAHYNATYKGVVPFYYNDSISGSYVASEGIKGNITLPTLKAYQRTLKKKEENKNSEK